MSSDDSKTGGRQRRSTRRAKRRSLRVPVDEVPRRTVSDIPEAKSGQATASVIPPQARTPSGFPASSSSGAELSAEAESPDGPGAASHDEPSDFEESAAPLSDLVGSDLPGEATQVVKESAPHAPPTGGFDDAEVTRVDTLDSRAESAEKNSAPDYHDAENTDPGEHNAEDMGFSADVQEAAFGQEPTRVVHLDAEEAFREAEAQDDADEPSPEPDVEDNAEPDRGEPSVVQLAPAVVVRGTVRISDIPPRPDDVDTSATGSAGEPAANQTLPEPEEFELETPMPTFEVDLADAPDDTGRFEMPDEPTENLHEDKSEPPPPPDAAANRPAEPSRAEPPPPPSAAAEEVVVEPQKPAEAKKRRRGWFETFFNDDYLRTVPRASASHISRQCDFIEKTLGLEQGATILDVGCGLGLHTVELASRGYQVVGLDLSLPMLSRAADEAQDRGQKINFLHADMREMSFEGAFDAIVCWGTTLGYFDDETNRKVTAHLHRALKPKGLLLIEMVNRDYVIRSQPNLVWFEGEGCVCMEETTFNYVSSRLQVKRTVMLDDSRQRESHYSVRLYSFHEFGQLLHTQGFRVASVSAHESTPGVFFGADSRRFILLAERRPDAPSQKPTAMQPSGHHPSQSPPPRGKRKTGRVSAQSMVAPPPPPQAGSERPVARTSSGEVAPPPPPPKESGAHSAASAPNAVIPPSAAVEGAISNGATSPSAGAAQASETAIEDVSTEDFELAEDDLEED